MRICVIDGQGGGIGAALIKRLKEVYQEEVEVIALGTNAVATAQMMKARANRGASGENAIVRTIASADVILGPLSIVLANSMMGEVTPRMAEAIASAPAPKILLPLTQEKVQIVGLTPEPLPHLVEKMVSEKLKELLRHV
jgi:NAD(P)-dependent dehydrogenase (short-subunit alcohol dehydrogenase family)